MQKRDKIKNDEKIEMPRSAGFHVEIDRGLGGMAVCVNGVISIMDFADDTAVLKVRGGRIRIIGKGLSISVFNNSAVEVKGIVARVELL